MIIKRGEVSSGRPALVPEQEVRNQPVLRHRSTGRHGAERRVLNPIEERGTHHKRVCSLQKDIEVVSDSGALSDGHIDRSRRVRHCEKR